MGMSASQVRFLSLQHRKHDIGRELTNLSNRKMSLSRDMNRVALNYTNALNQIDLKWSNDSGGTYYNLNYDLMMKPNDINCEKPYIITDRQGRVVVDNQQIVWGPENDRHETGITYRQLAEMITSYSGLDSANNTTYNNTSLLEGYTGSYIAGSDLADIDSSAISGTRSADQCEYTLVGNFSEYNFDNSLRYDVMTRLGLISQTELTTYKTLLLELYGSDSACDRIDYEALLADFDKNKLADVLGDGTGYSDIFGNLTHDGTNFELNAGSAYGNLALAKAYQREYQAYLETEIPHDILVTSQQKIMDSDLTDTNMLDKSNTTALDGFAYDSDTKTGISFRMVDMLNAVGEVGKTGNTFTFDEEGILENLLFYKASGEQADTLGLAISSSGNPTDFRYDADNSGQFDNGANTQHSDQTGFIDTWAKVFDYNGAYDAGSGSYDVDSDGYFTGADYIDNHSNNVTGLVLVGHHHMDDGSNLSRPEDHNLCYFSDFVDALAASFATITNIDYDAVDYAKRETKNLYWTIGARREEDDGSYKQRKVDRRATSVCDTIFGLGWCNKFGSNNDGTALYLTNVMNVFMTLYQMRASVDDEARINNGGSGSEKVLLHSITDASSMFNTSLQNALNSSTNPLDTLFSEWKTEDGTTGVTITEPSGSGAGTYEFVKTYTYKDEDDNTVTETSKVIVTGTRTGSTGSTFSAITSIEFKEENESGALNTSSKYTYDSASDKIVQYVYGNNTSGTYGQRATVTYIKNLNGKIAFNSGFKPTFGSGGQVNVINMESDGSSYKISSIETNYGTYDPDDMSSIPNSLKENSREYFIVDKDNTSIQDSELLYKLELSSPNDSVFTSTISLKPEDKYSKQLDDLVLKCQNEVDKLLEKLENCFGAVESKFMDYFDIIFKRISENGWVYDENVNGKSHSSEYLNAMLENNTYFVTEAREKTKETGYVYTTKLATTITKIYQVHDSNAENQALAEYESAKTLIQMKEKKVDARMQRLETEQEVINTELQSIEKVRNENIDRTFKIFA
ncbi:MAG: hypothetical protein K6E29_07930 [Cyanobacteria bacterium RUI128]|nr:hypothetical protein [Cyanobacteria bacterium RUI128]